MNVVKSHVPTAARYYSRGGPGTSVARRRRVGLGVPTVLLVLIVLSGCASVRPREHAVVNTELVPSGRAVLEDAPALHLETSDRNRLVSIDVVSEREVLLGYAGVNDFDRESAVVRRFSEVVRLDPETGEAESLPAGYASADGEGMTTPRFRDFRDRTPEEQVWFGGSLVINPEERERLYTFLLDPSPGYGSAHNEGNSASLPVALRASYGSGPHFLRVIFFGPEGRRDWRLRLVTLDMERGVTPRLLRQLSAMRWDGERYVTFYDSIFDLKTGDRHRLIDNVPSTFVELVAVDPSWSRTAIVYGEQRVAKELALTTLTVPRGD